MRLVARSVLLALIVALGLGTAVAAAAPAAGGTAPQQTRIWLNVTAVDPTSGAEITAPIVAGANFQYRFAVYCSQVGPGCLDAKTTFVIPAGVTVSGPATTANRLVQYDSATRTVTVNHQERWSYTSSTTGIPSGATRRFAVDARVENTTSPGRILLTGTSSARNAPASNESAAVTVGVPTGTLAAAASNSLSATSLITLTKARTTATLGVRNASTGGAKVASLTAAVSSPTWDLFYLYDIKTITTMPAGADQVSLQYCGIENCTADQYTALPPVPGSAVAMPAGVNRRAVSGLKFVFSNSAGTPLPASTTFSSQAVVFEMRDDFRGAGMPLDPIQPTTASICTVPAATGPAGTVRGADACTTLTYQRPRTSMTATAFFFPDADGSFTDNGTAAEGASSPVSLVSAAQNTSPFSVGSLRFFRRSSDNIQSISAVRLTFPAGATSAEVVRSCSGASKTTTVAASAGPVVDLTDPNPCGTGAPTTDVSVLYTGSIPAGATGGLAYHGTLAGGIRAGQVSEPVAVVASAGGSGSKSIDTSGYLRVNSAADPTGPFTADLRYTGGVDSAGRIFHGQPVTYQFTVTNRSLSPATYFAIDNPAAGVNGIGSVFNSFALTGVSMSVTPAEFGDQMILEIWDSQTDLWNPADGATPAQLAGAKGIRARMNSVGPFPAGASVTVSASGTVKETAPAGRLVMNCLSELIEHPVYNGGTGDVCAPTVTVGS